MNSKTLIIFEYRILFEILNEIRESLNFKIIQCDENEYNNIQFDPKVDYLVVSRKKLKNIKMTVESSIKQILSPLTLSIWHPD